MCVCVCVYVCVCISRYGLCKSNSLMLFYYFSSSYFIEKVIMRGKESI